MKVNVPLALSSNKIFEIFGQVSKLQDFEIIEMEQSIATAVYKEPYSIKQMLLKCLPCSTKELTQSPEFNEIEDMSMQSSRPTEQSSISAVRLQISINEIKCCRKISLKGLYGDQALLKNFIGIFRKKIHDFVNSLPGGSNAGVEQQNMLDQSHDTEMSSFRGGAMSSIGDIATQRSIYSSHGGAKSFKGTLRNTTRKLNAQNDDKACFVIGEFDEDEDMSETPSTA